MRTLSWLTTMLVGTLALSSASAAPPPIRPLDVRTIHAINETARKIDGELAREKAAVPPRTRLIVIDPGHGGSNLGAVGVAEIREKLITMDLAYALRDALEAKYPDAVVLMTRYWDRDVDLDLRIQWANDVGADLFLSLHYNAASHDRALGYETFFLAEATMGSTAERGSRKGQQATKAQRRAFRGTDRARVVAHRRARAKLVPAHEQSKVLATVVQAELARRLESINRGVKEANFAVLRGARMPAVVIEGGFLTHPVEGRAVLMRPHRDAVVGSIVAAVQAYNASLPKPKPPAAKEPVISSRQP